MIIFVLGKNETSCFSFIFFSYYYNEYSLRLICITMSREHIQSILESSEEEDNQQSSPPQTQQGPTDFLPNMDPPVYPQTPPKVDDTKSSSLPDVVENRLRKAIKLPGIFYVGLSAVTKKVVDNFLPKPMEVGLEETKDNILFRKKEYDQEFAKLIPLQALTKFDSALSSPVLTIPSLLAQDVVVQEKEFYSSDEDEDDDQVTGDEDSEFEDTSDGVEEQTQEKNPPIVPEN